MTTRTLLTVLLLAGLPAGIVRAGSAEPPLLRSVVRLEPAERQLRTLPAFPARWLLSAGVAADLSRILKEKGFAPVLREELCRRLLAVDGSPDAALVPDRALIARFNPAERAAWSELLCRHPANETYRWPLSLGPVELARLDAESRWREALARIRATAFIHGDRLIFGDLFALEDAFASPQDQRDFYGIALGGDALLLRLHRARGQTLDAAAQAGWWQVNGRYRAIEPMFNAVAALPNGPRLDLIHLLARLPRSLLNSFPPDLAGSDDAGIESSVMASDFFSLIPGADPRTEGAFRDWISREAVPAEGPPLYGDLLVYGDPATTPWPYTAVYIADNIAFSRRPTAYGPWQFIDLAEIGRLNPRFAGTPPKIFRCRAALTPVGQTPFIPGRMPEAWRRRLQLRSVQPGPWGKLRFYDVLLAPAGDILEQLPAPESHPRWKFHGLTRADLIHATETIAMPDGVRSALRGLFSAAAPDADGDITVEPPLELVLAVPSEFRSATFTHLVGGLSVTDYAQNIPFPRGFTIDEWFDAGSLPETVRQAILRLVYPVGDHVMLSDFGALYGLLDTRREQLSAQRAALRTPALIVLLEKPAPAEVPALAKYWTYGHDKNVLGLLESFAADPEQRYLDVIHLLPPIERELLNTYFTPDGPVPVPSCFWTAFNFGAEKPDARYLVIPGVWTEQRELAWQELTRDFDPVTGPSQLGDIIGYRRKDAKAFDHVCVFLAGDLVFTKNGFTFSSPWCISRLSDLDLQYRTTPDVERIAFRRRTPP